MLDQKIAEVCFHTKSVDQSMKCNSCLRFYQSLMLSVQNFISNFSQLFCLILSITKWEQLGGEHLVSGQASKVIHLPKTQLSKMVHKSYFQAEFG